MGFDVEQTKERAVPTLSSTVSNLDSKMASISGLNVSVDSYCSALLNLVIWSTASLPTKASPMNTTKFGLFIFTNRANSFIKGVLSCMRPAVSTRTASMCFLVAQGRRKSTSLIAQYAITAGSSLYPREYTGISRFRPWVQICSTAPARKLSQAANMTDNLAFFNLYATLAKLVDFPTPLTPTKTITYGFSFSLYLVTSTTRSIFRLGVRIFLKASFMASFTVFLTEVNDFVLVQRRVAPTASATWTATSWATFFYIRLCLKSARTYTKSSFVMVLSPTTLRNLPTHLLNILLLAPSSQDQSSLSRKPEGFQSFSRWYLLEI